MDEDKILYCPKCLSIQILAVEGTDLSYCGKCGCANIQEIDFDEWDKMYQNKYKTKFLWQRKKR